MSLKMPTPAELQRTEDSLVKRQALIIVELEAQLVHLTDENARLRGQAGQQGRREGL